MDSTPEGSKHKVGNGKSESRAYTFQDWEWESIQAVAEHHGFFSGKVPLRAASSVFFDDILPAETGLVFSFLFFSSLLFDHSCLPAGSRGMVTRNSSSNAILWQGIGTGSSDYVFPFQFFSYFPPFFSHPAIFASTFPFHEIIILLHMSLSSGRRIIHHLSHHLLQRCQRGHIHVLKKVP